MITLKQFETISIVLTAEEECSPDLSWADDEMMEDIRNGKYQVFVAKVAVIKNGHEIGTDYLGNCVYESLEDFAEGAAPGSNDYCRDMMHEALSEARATIGRYR